MLLSALVNNYYYYLIWHRNATISRGAVAHKGLNLPKRFTNLLLGSMSLILNKMDLMHQYGSLGVPWTPKSCDALIEVFKFVDAMDMCKNKLHVCTYSTVRFALRFVNLFVEGVWHPRLLHSLVKQTANIFQSSMIQSNATIK